MKKFLWTLKLFVGLVIAFLLTLLPKSLFERLMNFCTNGKWNEMSLQMQRDYSRLLEREYLKGIEREYNKRYRDSA